MASTWGFFFHFCFSFFPPSFIRGLFFFFLLAALSLRRREEKGGEEGGWGGAACEVGGWVVRRKRKRESVGRVKWGWESGGARDEEEERGLCGWSALPPLAICLCLPFPIISFFSHKKLLFLLGG